ncbi:MAG: polymer-forming cytoskeletal protein [Croceibacterium sp.]
MFSKKSGQSPAKPQAAGARSVANGSTFSVIGTDVAIRGDIHASADLHVDGSVTGDLTCARLVQGEASLIEGAIVADSARLAGTVKGTITARELVILKSARIEGDVHYEALTIEQGASVDGRFAPDAAKAARSADDANVLTLNV